jgi:hypothetical protein
LGSPGLYWRWTRKSDSRIEWRREMQATENAIRLIGWISLERKVIFDWMDIFAVPGNYKYRCSADREISLFFSLGPCHQASTVRLLWMANRTPLLNCVSKRRTGEARVPVERAVTMICSRVVEIQRLATSNQTASFASSKSWW